MSNSFDELAYAFILQYMTDIHDIQITSKSYKTE